MEKKAFENIVVNRIFSFSHSDQPIKEKLHHLKVLFPKLLFQFEWMTITQTLQLVNGPNGAGWWGGGGDKLILGFTPFSNKPWFLVSEVFWKHWEKQKLLVTSNFSFSHNVFYLLGKAKIFIKF